MPMQNKILRADALEIRGWPHQELKKRVSYAIGHYSLLPKLFQNKFSVGEILNTARFAHLNGYTAIGTWWD